MDFKHNIKTVNKIYEFYFATNRSNIIIRYGVIGLSYITYKYTRIDFKHIIKL